jgi:hypothetical protein
MPSASFIAPPASYRHVSRKSARSGMVVALASVVWRSARLRIEKGHPRRNFGLGGASAGVEPAPSRTAAPWLI